jgi:hypothetical protein
MMPVLPILSEGFAMVCGDGHSPSVDVLEQDCHVVESVP